MAPSESCAVVVFGDPPRSGVWRVWLLLILPPVLLAALSFGYAVFAVTLARGDTSVIGPAMAPALPYIVLANHSLLFALMLWFISWTAPPCARSAGRFPGDSPPASVGEVAVGLVAWSPS